MVCDDLLFPFIWFCLATIGVCVFGALTSVGALFNIRGGNKMKRLWILLIVLSVLLTGCASKEDKALAQEVIAQINNIESATKTNADEIYVAHRAYSNLTEKQQKLVTNSTDLFSMVATLENLIIEEEISKDPTNTITEAELVGIWRENHADSHRGYFYFTPNGYVYYLASKSAVSQSDFISDYILATSFSLNGYNRTTRAKDGGFYNTANRSDATFSVTKDALGNLTMVMECGVASGTYTKTGETVDTSPNQCLHSGCSNMAASTGDSFFCEKHSNRCLECNKYIDEDALLCLNCIVEALKDK